MRKRIYVCFLRNEMTIHFHHTFPVENVFALLHVLLTLIMIIHPLSNASFSLHLITLPYAYSHSGINMKKILIASLLICSLSALAETTPHWSYEGKAGPAEWGALSDTFSTCKTGKFQSPVDIRGVLDADIPPLDLVVHNAAESVVNNGHTIQVTVNDGDDFQLDNETFTLRQYHFHTPSENVINGKHYPLEVHFVHASDTGEIAVVAVMFDVGNENAALNPILNNMPAEKNKAVPVSASFDLTPLFPTDRHYYRFSGSLTTPPCTEGLRWIVMKNSVQLSAEQLGKFQAALGQHNNRPVQPLNGRMIVE